MKRLVEVKSDSGLVTLLGEPVLLMCINYFYAGTLSGVNKTHVELSDPKLVYETGEWSSGAWKDAQKLPAEKLYVRLSCIESWMKVGK